jgi:hypothetical protein
MVAPSHQATTKENDMSNEVTTKFGYLWLLEQSLDEADPNQYCAPSPEMESVYAAFDKLPAAAKLSAYVLFLRKLQEFLASDKSPLTGACGRGRTVGY